MENATKPTKTFWIISSLALVWNLLGVFAYLGQAYMTSEAKAILPENEQLYYENLPAWVTAAFAISVFAGLIGSILLLMRKKSATYLFLLSLIAILGQFIYNFFMQSYVETMGSKGIMPMLVLVLGIFLVYFSNKSKEKGMLT